MLGTRMATYQTAGWSCRWTACWSPRTTDIAKELYLSVLVDRSSKPSPFIASAEGGMDIEQVAHENPEKSTRCT